MAPNGQASPVWDDDRQQRSVDADYLFWPCFCAAKRNSHSTLPAHNLA
jgi:hypothetical protein